MLPSHNFCHPAECTKDRREFLPGELWLGLRKIHQLTTEGDYSLHVTLIDFDTKIYQAVYDHFEVITQY